jgi:flap endonuclease-1
LGVQLRDLLSPAKIGLEELSGKSVAFDGNNILYQFLAIIRGEDGEPLYDASGRITSHLSGLIYRNSNLVEAGIRVAYVFDGRPPDLKKAEIERRRESRSEAQAEYRKALEKGAVEEARKYAQRAVSMTNVVVEDAKSLLSLMGIPWIQAPSEGEAQSAYMAMKGDVWASGSQDFDSLLFGAPRLLRNLSITGRRKLPNKKLYIKIEPELIELEGLLSELGITREQLIDIGILTGTDFNPDGVKGIGPKKALRLIKKYSSLEEALPYLEGASFPYPIESIREIFLKPPVTDNYRLEWRQPDEEGILEFLCTEHSFNRERVAKAIEKLKLGMKRQEETTTLDKWFGGPKAKQL